MNYYMTEGNHKYWMSLEHLNRSEGFSESLGKEFSNPPEKQEVTKLERRDFLKAMGASFLMATMACTRKPVENIIPYVNAPEEVTPGVANWYTSTCQECSAGCGVLVKNREGRPVKLDGNQNHPISEGGLCARGQASILNLYYPGRLQKPVFQDGQTQKEISQNEADQSIIKFLNEAKKAGSVALLTGAVTSPTTKKLINEFLSDYSNSKHVSFEPALPEEISLAYQQTHGQKVMPVYHFDKAEVIVSFGADFLGTYLSPVQAAKKFAKARTVEEGKKARFISFESGLSLTGTNADERFQVQPGDEVLVAKAIANELGLIKNPPKDRTGKDVAGIKAETIKQVAELLWNSKGKSLVVGGPVKGRNALALQIVVNEINDTLASHGQTITFGSNQISSYADVKNLVSSMEKGEIKVLLIAGLNPVFALPSSLKFSEALKKVPTTIQLTEQLNETSAKANYVLPVSHYLESWGDSQSQAGVLSLVQPVVNPLYETRSLAETLLALSGATVSWLDYLKKSWNEMGANFEEAQQKGFVVLKSSNEPTVGGFNSQALSVVAQAKTLGAEKYSLQLYPSVSIYDGRSANNAWLQELPDPISKVAWGNYLAVSPKTAEKLNLVQGDVVSIKTGSGAVTAPVNIQPGLHEKALMLAVGYGRSVVGNISAKMEYPGYDFGVVGENLGVNAFSLQENEDSISWGLDIEKIEKTGAREKLAITQPYPFMDGRDPVRETTLAEYEKNPEAGNEEKPSHLTMWAQHAYDGYKWGMAVDLNSCTGCSACTIACQSENNIPVVGPRQILIGREMHWIRIDRYYTGSAENPEVVYQPMLCQHCENAPCETVCPVLATVHDAEGLNQMIYNRCVGTRYCANNCPYKVRRFNYFEYSKAFKEPATLGLSPDVSVRTRGVMEKCSFCIQRIRVGKDTAKDESRRVKDGDIKPSCVQGCPSDALVFGDLNDPQSKISKFVKSPRGYHVLEELNTKPRVTYLTKVRNKMV